MGAAAAVYDLLVGFALGIGNGLAIVAARFILRPFLEVLHTPEEIIGQSYAYVSLITLFIGVMFAYNLCAGLLRAIGNSVMPLLFLVLCRGRESERKRI